jgi:serine/threonine protein kinase
LVPANILVDQNFSAKIIDFSNNPAATCGTLLWTAPECILSPSFAVQLPSSRKAGLTHSSPGKSVLTPSADQLPSDVYSFGVVAYECLSRREPFEGYKPADVVAGVAAGSLRLPIPPGCGAEMAVLLNECLSFESIRRPPFAEIERRLAALDPSQVTSDAFSAAEHSAASMLARLPVHRRFARHSSAASSATTESQASAEGIASEGQFGECSPIT